MKIVEACDNWSLELNHGILETEIGDEQKELLKNILHTTGDSLGVVLGMPIEETELRSKLLEAITSIYLDTRKQIQVAVEFIIMNQAITAPLQKGFTDQELYGENLTDSLRASLKDEEEFGIADEYLTDDDDEETDED